MYRTQLLSCRVSKARQFLKVAGFSKQAFHLFDAEHRLKRESRDKPGLLAIWID